MHLRDYCLKIFLTRRLWPVLAIAALVAAAPALWPGRALAAAPNHNAQITYTKTLKGSVPEYEKVAISSDGSGVYDGHGLNSPPNPRHFKLSEAAVQKIFALAADLKDFNGVNLESGKHVANLGLKR
ncbi:MAG: hypothetical protein ACRD10_04755, partial [Terriglobia bacterium]